MAVLNPLHWNCHRRRFSRYIIELILGLQAPAADYSYFPRAASGYLVCAQGFFAQKKPSSHAMSAPYLFLVWYFDALSIIPFLV